MRKVRYLEKNFREQKVRGKRNFPGKKHRMKVNSESVGAIFRVASIYTWDRRKLDLTTCVTLSSFFFPF